MHIAFSYHWVMKANLTVSNMFKMPSHVIVIL